jgi:hypothetical protein
MKSATGRAGHAWHHYWERFHQSLSDTPYADPRSYIHRTIGGADDELQILSLGNVSLRQTLDLASLLPAPYRVTCIDRDRMLFDQISDSLDSMAIRLEFREAEFDRLLIEPRRYDLVVAHAALDPVVKIRRLFEQIAGSLSAQGLFHMVEVTGRNRRLLWEENRVFANAVLDVLPSAMTGGARLAAQSDSDLTTIPSSEDILPSLRDVFSIEFEKRHGTFMRFICAHPVLAESFDADTAATRAALAFLIDCDEAAMRSEVLQPFEIWGFYRASLGPNI